MALSLNTLEDELYKLMDINHPNFVGYPNDITGVATNWSNAIYNYAISITPSTTSAVTAKNSMKNVLLGVTPNSFFPFFESSFTAFANSLKVGMTGYSSVAPPTPIVLEAPMMAIPLTPAYDSLRVPTLAGIIHNWFKTGVSTLLSAPYTVVQWN